VANDKKVQATRPSTQNVDLSELEIPAGDSSFVVELAEPVPAGKKAVVSGHLIINIVDA